MQRRNRDIDYAFRQDSDLLYLCGFEEPDALLVLVPGRSQGEVILFCRERDRGRNNGMAVSADPSGPLEGSLWTMRSPLPMSTIYCRKTFRGSAADLPNNGRIPRL